MPVTRFDSGDVSSAPLAQPLKFEFSRRVAPNRLMKAAMEETLSTWDAKILENRGVPTKELIEVYRRWGEQPNGWGIIITGSIPIEFDHVPGAGDAIITPECAPAGDRFEAFRTLAAAAKANGSLIIGQVNHPGRQVQDRYCKEPISASAVTLHTDFGWTFAPPRAATKADIARIVAGFAHAAEYLERAGFDGINLHAAHGYLLAQFLSARTNRRTDEYGGAAGPAGLRGRARLLVEVCRAIRARVSPGFVLSAKLNSTDFQDDGFQPAEARALVRVLQDEIGLDFVELSGGTYEHLGLEWTKESTRRREAFFLEFAEMIVPGLSDGDDGEGDGDSTGKDHASPSRRRKTKVFVTGGLRSVGAMVRAIDVVDGVGVARPAAQEPRLAADILAGRVRGAIQPLAPFDNNSGLGMLAAGIQIRQIAHGQEPFDLSDEEDVKVLWAEVEAWTRENKPKDKEEDGEEEDKEDKEQRVGMPDWKGRVRPYGTVGVTG